MAKFGWDFLGRHHGITNDGYGQTSTGGAAAPCEPVVKPAEPCISIPVSQYNILLRDQIILRKLKENGLEEFLDHLAMRGKRT